MTLQEAKKLAQNLMREHGLTYDGWTFKFDNARRRAGVCKYYNKTIGLSKYLLPYMKDDKVKDTLLHEIAHAMVGAGHGHNRVWQTQAIAIGCNGARCYNPETEFHAGAVEELAVQSKYSLSCPECGRVTAVHRKPKRSKACGKCCKEHNFGRYTDRFKMVLTQNY